MVHAIRWLGTVGIVMMLGACGGGGNNNDTNGGGGTPPPDVSRLVLDIADARGLVITGDTAIQSSNATSPDLDPNSLYKVTMDGRLEKVTPTTPDGQPLPAGIVQPVRVAQLSNRFLWMEFAVPGTSPQTLYYLVDTHTGRAFLEDGEIWALHTFAHVLNVLAEHIPMKVQTDNQGNLYLGCGGPDGGWENFWKGLCKIDTTKIDSGGDVTVEEITRSVDIFNDSFWVPGDATFYITHAYNEQGVFEARLRPMGALGFDRLPSGYDALVRGLDGEIYVVPTLDEPGATPTLYRIGMGVKDSGGPAAVFEELGAWEGPWASGLPRVIGGKMLLLHQGVPGLEIDIPARRGQYRSAEILDGFAQLHGSAHLFNVGVGQEKFLMSERYVFVLGRTTDDMDVVRRWEPATGETVTFDQLGADYDIHKIKVLGGGDAIWFEALRHSDETRVIGELTIDGTVTELETISATLSSNIETLVPINPANFIAIDGNAGDWLDEYIVLSGQTGAADITRIGIAGERTVVKLLIDLTKKLDKDLRLSFDTTPGVPGGEYLVYYSADGIFELVTPDDESVALAGSRWVVAEGASAVEIAAVLSEIGSPSQFSLVVSLGTVQLDNEDNITGFAPSQSTTPVLFEVD